MTIAETRARSRTSTTVGDLVRVVAALAIPVGTVLYGPVATALLSLVLLGTVIPRAIGLRGGIDPGVGLTLSVAAWIALLDLYARVPWLDLVMHLAATAALTVLAYAVLVFVGAVEAPGRLVAHVASGGRSSGDPALRRPRLGVVVLATGLGVLLALLWELGEWAGATYVDPAIQVGYEDTLGDLVAGGVGAFLAGIVLVGRS